MPPDQSPDPAADRAADDPRNPGREQREYPHGTGDRNAFSPTREKDPMPHHEGGSQRTAPAGPQAGR